MTIIVDRTTTAMMPIERLLKVFRCEPPEDRTLIVGGVVAGRKMLGNEGFDGANGANASATSDGVEKRSAGVLASIRFKTASNASGASDLVSLRCGMDPRRCAITCSTSELERPKGD